MSCVRFALCCLFREEPIRFRRATARGLNGLDRREQLERLSRIALDNAGALMESLDACRGLGFGGFRINSQILPLRTHPEVGYRLRDLPSAHAVIDGFERCRAYGDRHGIRRTFHPDQFVLLSSPREDVTRSSLDELRCQAEVSALVGADVINIHAGGAYGSKEAALDRLMRALEALPDPIRGRLTLENDDRIYTPSDLLPVCARTGIPLIYDVHHHRCLPDGLSVEECTDRALESWMDGREPLVHLSSPRGGWDGPDPRRHADFIDPADFPDHWTSLTRPLTVEVEAKAKELAVRKLLADLAGGTPGDDAASGVSSATP